MYRPEKGDDVHSAYVQPGQELFKNSDNDVHSAYLQNRKGGSGFFNSDH